MNRRAFSLPKTYLVVTALLLCLPSLAGAWGRWQHEVIAKIAEQNLTPAARKEVAKILGSPSRLSAVASWADKVRYYRKYTAPWHYINYPLELDEPDYDIMNTAEGNVVYAVEKQISLLKDPAVRGKNREEALKFLVHFVGDLHQPLHCGKGEDRGGNDVPIRWRHKKTNLHKAWDRLIFDGKGRSADSWARYSLLSISADRRTTIMQGQPYDWMVESHILARDVCYARLPRRSDFSSRSRGPELSFSYAHSVRPVFERRLVEAGLRLAKVLNDIFTGEGTSAK